MYEMFLNLSVKLAFTVNTKTLQGNQFYRQLDFERTLNQLNIDIIKMAKEILFSFQILISWES